MKKVCHMTSRHMEEDVRIFHKECVSLAKAGYDVYLVERGKTYDKNGVHIVGVGELGDSKEDVWYRNPQLVYEKALELDADIYHFHDTVLFRQGLMLKRKGKTVIFDSHENELGYRLNTIRHEKFSDEFLNLIRIAQSMRFDWRQRHICKRLDCVITVTPAMNDYFLKFQPNSVTITNYPLLEEMGETHGQDHNPHLLGFAGGISRQWNHVSIIRALERLPDMRYVLMGQMSGDELRNLPAWKQVDFRGRIPHEEVSAILSRCGIGLAIVTPSQNSYFWEGTLGNTKLFEEMMAGLPVICTRFRLWQEIIDKYQCGICVTPGNVEELVAAIRYLADHPAEARKMGENGRRAVEEEYNWSTQEKKLLEVYANL